MATTLPRNTGLRAHLRALRSIHNAPRSFVSAWPKSLCRPQARYNSTETVVTLRRPTGGFDEEPITYDTQSGYGFAPIKHGDLVGPEGRFEILRKLGWGCSGTTWLVKDVKEDRKYLALKVLTAGNTSLVSRDVDDPAGIVYDECRIMQRVSEPSSHPGAQYCLKLINQFYLDSAAGRHLCLLTELAGLTLGDVQDMLVTRDGFPSELAKIIVRELCLALDHLHRECRVVHAGMYISPVHSVVTDVNVLEDLKMSNVLITFNDLDTRDLAELLVKFRPLETYLVRRMDDVHVQTIKSQPLPQPGFADVHPAHYHFKITDYRSAQWLDRARPTHVLEPVDLRAPEMILGLPWDEKVDIWTIGCMVCYNALSLLQVKHALL
ncbi:kinase-like domain-containing protein [Sparassis latifolia]